MGRDHPDVNFAVDWHSIQWEGGGGGLVIHSVVISHFVQQKPVLVGVGHLAHEDFTSLLLFFNEKLAYFHSQKEN